MTIRLKPATRALLSVKCNTTVPNKPSAETVEEAVRQLNAGE